MYDISNLTVNSVEKTRTTGSLYLGNKFLKLRRGMAMQTGLDSCKKKS
jgi:hypothetical protein